MQLVIVVLQLLVPVVFFGILYIVVNKAVLHALRTDRAERQQAAQPRAE